MLNLNGSKGLFCCCPENECDRLVGWGLRNVLRVGFKTFQAQMKTSKSRESGQLSVQRERVSWDVNNTNFSEVERNFDCGHGHFFGFEWLCTGLRSFVADQADFFARFLLPSRMDLYTGNLQSISRSVVGFGTDSELSWGKNERPFLTPTSAYTPIHTYARAVCVCVVNAKRIVRFTLFDSYCNHMNIFAAL